LYRYLRRDDCFFLQVRKYFQTKGCTRYITKVCVTGFFFTDGPFWTEQRRYSLRHLRDLGFGKKSLELIIWDEVEVLFKKLQNADIQVRSSR
jgi:hypothetical protein